MENEVSGIAKLGIVLIALAILIGLGFGIFQISKSVANDGVGDVQSELDSVSASAYSTYDQKTITGTMVSSAVADFEGESTAVLIATQSWKDAMAKAGTGASTGTSAADAISNTITEADLADAGVSSGMTTSYGDSLEGLPVVRAMGAKQTDGEYNAMVWSTSTNQDVDAHFINYNAILGALEETNEDCTIKNNKIKMAYIYFDNNCYRCESSFATDGSGKVIFNNIATNLSKSGRTEYISSSAKFESYLIKDNSGTTMGVAMEQIGA